MLDQHTLQIEPTFLLHENIIHIDECSKHGLVSHSFEFDFGD
jgi:hypothetical protein